MNNMNRVLLFDCGLVFILIRFQTKSNLFMNCYWPKRMLPCHFPYSYVHKSQFVIFTTFHVAKLNGTGHLVKGQYSHLVYPGIAQSNRLVKIWAQLVIYTKTWLKCCYFEWEGNLSQKLRYFRGSRFSQCFIVNSSLLLVTKYVYTNNCHKITNSVQCYKLNDMGLIRSFPANN